MSYSSKGRPSDDCIKYPPEPSERPRPRAVWTGLDGQHSSSTRSSYGDSSVQGEAVEVHSVDANGMLLAGQAQYGVSPPGTDRQMFPLLAKKFEEAVEQNEELRSEIDRLTQCCNQYIGEADKAVKDMKARQRTQLNKEKTHATEMKKLYEDTLKQYEDAKIVVLSYKSKNIELEGHIRGLTAQLEEAQKVAQRGASGSPRELERLRREVAELKRDNEACLVGLRLKDEDLREMCDKRDVCKKSFQQAADERDHLAVQVAQLQRRLAELDSSSNKKELSALRMQLQDSQVSNTGLQQQLQDLKQQLQSASTGSLLQQQEAQGLTAAMEERHERDLLEQKEQVSEWKVRCHQAEEQVRSVRGEVETLKSDRSELQITVNGMKKALDAKEELIRDLQAERSTLESVAQELRQSALGRPSDGEADRLAMQLQSAQDKIRHLESELRQLKRDAGRVEQQSPTSPAALMPQTRQMNQLLNQLEEAKRREREFEQECEHLHQIEAEMSRELSSSKEKTEELRWHLSARENELMELNEHLQMKSKEMVSTERTLNDERESLRQLQSHLTYLQDTHQQEKQQLESRVEQTEGRYKGYRQELKHHAEALMKVSQELQTERANQVKLKAELNQCRQELRSLEKTGHDLKEEQSTSNLLREQLKQYVSDFQMEKQGHQRTVQDKRALEQRVRDLEKEVRQLQQAYDSRQQAQLGHLYKVDSQDEPARGGRSDQFTEFARPAPPMYPTANRPGSAAQVPKAGGIQPPGGGTRRDPTAASQAYIHPPAPGGGVQDQRGAVGDDPAARRHPCPICGRTFPDLQKLERHASNCNGN